MIPIQIKKKTLRNKFVTSFQSQIMAAFIVLIVLDGLYITNRLIALFVPIRYGLLAFILAGSGIFLLSRLKSGSIKKNQFYAIFFHLILLSYGLFLSTVYGGFLLLESGELVFTFLSLFLTLVLFLEFNRNSKFFHWSISNASWTNYYKGQINFNSFLIILLIISPLLLYFFNAIELRPIPRINFDLSAADGGYLQATSKFFGLGSILLLFIALQKKTHTSSIFFLSFSFMLLGLSGLGGARGEFLICILVMFFLLFSFPTRKKNLFLILICFAALFWFFSFFAETVDNLLIIQRLSVLGSGNFGLRDQLLIQSFRLLGERPDCALIGCGFNYFQVHFGYGYGMYPHNFFAELLITFGVPLGGAVVILVCMGAAFGFSTSIKRTPLFWILLYFLGINLKSGSLLGLTSIAVVLYFAYLGILATRWLHSSVKLSGKNHNA